MKGRSRRQLMLQTFVIILFINYYVAVSSAQGIQTEHVCKSIDVRNTVENFNKYLENCTVIEGYLRILLIDRAVPSDYTNLTFPNLREITDYFLLFRVAGLKSLRHLFPNLAVIRGSKLFHNYAFVVFEMLDLQEIGLPQLTNIIRGGVRIEKNPNLCYIDTIDWDHITKATVDIRANSDENECPNTCPDSCPLSRKNSKKNSFMCWSGYDCQKICTDEKCGACERDLKSCCHRQCLGGCNGTSQADCFVCKNFLLLGKCVDSCPFGTFEFNNRRCLSKEECINTTINTKVVFKPINLSNVTGGKCSSSCPNGYTENRLDRTLCGPCEGSCPKECAGGQITSIADAQHFEGCTKINGYLDIQITGGKNIVKELETHLEKIKEITDYLKVVRSVPLMSLNFLKNLETIGGVDKQASMYALYVLDNPNLEYLWDWKNRVKLTIGSGKVFFHYNPKLCLDKIRELENITNANKSDDKDVSKQSNGNRIACTVKDLKIFVNSTDVSMAIVKWENFVQHISDPRSVLGYLVSYKEAPYENVTLFDDHDACSMESWKVIDFAVEETSGNNSYEQGLISNLKPFTKYAVYVKTYTIATETNGGESKIIYFTTKPTTPTTPVDLKVFSKSPNELIVTWKPPKYPNGYISYYIVKWTRKEDSQEFLDMRNYCTEPLTKIDTKQSKAVNDDKPFSNNNNGSSDVQGSEKCCACPKDKKQLEEEDAERQYQIQFENFLHNTVYVKRPSSAGDNFVSTNIAIDRAKRMTSASIEEDLEVSNGARRDTFQPQHMYSRSLNNEIRGQLERKSTRSTVTTTSPTSTTSTPTTTTFTKGLTDLITNGSTNVSGFHNGTNITDQVTVKSNRSLNATILSLKHFSEYLIEIVACQDVNGENKQQVCSSEAIITARTKHTEFVDDIESVSVTAVVENKTSNSVIIRWKVPPDPNGLILSFNVEINSSEAESSSSYRNLLFCITHKEYMAKNGYVAKGLLPGNYSLRLRATSLAGAGEYTSPTYFFIPEPSSHLTVGFIILIVLGVLVFVLSVIGGATFYIRKRYVPRVPDILYASVNPEYLSNMYVPDEWEIPREKISILKELGQGSFGMVYEGKAKDIVSDLPFVRCAVKTVNESATLGQRIEFLNEASVMKAFSCYHVVKLLGVVSKGQPTLVVMELMANGDLRDYLRSHRPDADIGGRQPPTLKRLLQMAIEIADGMAYLTEKKFVHRDLAARNCMVSETLTVKIGDFGMTRDIYETDYYRKGGKGLLPVRWMAPESLKDGVFTSHSDVWSYGIVLWEMATLASQPYQGLSNEQVLKYVIDGGIMEKPENCPDRLYELMRGCFHYNPRFRPTFIQLIENLLPEANANFSQVSFYYNGHNGERDFGGDHPNDDLQDDHDDDCCEEEEEVSSSTPLRSPQDAPVKGGCGAGDEENGGEHKNKSSSYTKHFRLQNRPSSKHRHHHHHHHHRHQDRYQPPMLPLIGGPAPPLTTAVNENGGKGVSPNSSDGSKASACSANGSILNGHVGVPLSINRTAEC